MNALRRSFEFLLGKRPLPLQVAALCIDSGTGRVLLITSRGTGRWVIPKGWPMAGRSLPGAAAQEAWEEAGVTGQVEHKEIGRYSYDKAQDSGFSITVEVAVFALHVEKLLDKFPEDDERERKWFTLAEAVEMVAEPGLQEIFRGLQPAQA